MTMPNDPGSEHVETPRNPIVLGVTGHVDPRLEDYDALKNALREILADFRERYPHTPLVVLSPMARGGDQLAVEVALEQGARVIAPLPFPTTVYAQSSSFEGDDPARDRFLNWVSDPRWKGKVRAFVVNRPDEPEHDDLARWTAWMKDRQERHVCYANAGGYILRHCHALIAFWDGQDPTRPSGTGEVVACKRNGQTLRFDPWRTRLPLLNADAAGPVYVIHTPRIGKANPDTGPAAAPAAESAAPDPDRPGSWRVLTPNASKAVSKSDLRWQLGSLDRFGRRMAEAMTLHPHVGHDHHPADQSSATHPDPAKADARRARAEFRQFHETCKTIDDFNHDAVGHAKRIAHRLAKLPESELGAAAAGMSLPEPLMRLMRLRAAAAEMAAKFDRHFTVYLIALFAMLFLAASSFHIYAHLESEKAPGVHDPFWLAAFVELLLLHALLVCWVWARRVGERRHDYRALAEALRVRIYWALAGIGKSVADSYLNQLRSEMSWTRRAVQCASPAPAYWSHLFRDKPHPEQLAQLRLVAERWVARQRDYFLDKFHDNHRDAARLRRIGFAMAFTGWLMAALLVLTMGISGASPQLDPALTEGSASKESATTAGANPRATTEAASWSADRPPPWVLIGSGVLVLAGAILIAYCERRSHEELARQYERMWAVFTRGAVELHDHLDAENVEAAQRVLETLGHEAIAEHAQWLILRRNRPFELLIH
jgi:hypothetical protein